jgi:YfiH family protein
MPTAASDPDPPSPPALRRDSWASIPGLFHGFYGRDGGFSDGPWRSLNLSEKVGDDPHAVERNWRRLLDALPGAKAVRMRQVHGDRVLLVEDSAPAPDLSVRGDCDGLVAAASGIALTVLTADCVPILLVAPSRRVVMALHAGWRGTLAGVAARGIEAARRWFGITPNEWQAALGPAIGPCCYEVEAEIGEQIEDRWGAMPDAWQCEGRHGHLDLRRVNAEILLQQGLSQESIDVLGPCTACDHDRFYSHRQSRGRSGRQVSLIGFEREFDVVSPANDR